MITKITASIAVLVLVIAFGGWLGLAHAQIYSSPGATSVNGTTGTGTGATGTGTARTTSTLGNKGTGVVPGTPNTGAGGNATTNALLIVGSLAALAVGTRFMIRATR